MEGFWSINITYVRAISTRQRATPTFIALLNQEAKDITIIVNYFVVCGTLAFLGIIGNLVNLVIFSKMGFENTMNISLCGIAVSDLCTLCPVIWYNICISPEFERSTTAVVSSEVHYLTAGWPHCLFARITCIITVYITIERFLCVALPLSIKKIITKTKTIFTVVLLFLSQILTTIPTYYTNIIDWKFFPNKNRSLLGMYRRGNVEQVESISFGLQSTMQGLSFVLLIFFTFLLLWCLRKKTKWRKMSTCDVQKVTVSVRDKKLVKMVVLIAAVLITCFTPGMICFCAMAIVPEYRIGGVYDSVFYVSWSFAFICQTFNSSINIVVYYNMSSNYRVKFDETFASCIKLFGHYSNKI